MLVSATSSSTEQFVVDSLMCCSNYSYQVAARTSAGEGVPSEGLRFMTNAQYNSTYVHLILERKRMINVSVTDIILCSFYRPLYSEYHQWT